MEDSSGNTLKNSMDQKETSFMTGSESNTEWTDEKHSLFLKSMETTFVNQLYKSLDLSGWHSRKSDLSGSKSSKQKQTSVRAPSGQFKVLRDGHWSNINFRRDEKPETDQEEESRVVLASPWIQHYRSSGRQAAMRRSPVSRPKSPPINGLNRYPPHIFQLSREEDSTDASNTEATGQNFIDEDIEEEDSHSINGQRGTKTTSDIVPNTDQVVPLGNIVQEKLHLNQPERTP